MYSLDPSRPEASQPARTIRPLDLCTVLSLPSLLSSSSQPREAGYLERRRRRIFFAIDLDAGRAGAPLILGDVAHGRGDMAAAASPGPLRASWAAGSHAHFGQAATR